MINIKDHTFIKFNKTGNGKLLYNLPRVPSIIAQSEIANLIWFNVRGNIGLVIKADVEEHGNWKDKYENVRDVEFDFS